MDIEAVVEKLRDAGDALASRGEYELLLPTPEQPPLEVLDAIRVGGTVRCEDVGRLVYYLGDMLEE
jgi:hypothetical protein